MIRLLCFPVLNQQLFFYMQQIVLLDISCSLMTSLQGCMGQQECLLQNPLTWFLTECSPGMLIAVIPQERQTTQVFYMFISLLRINMFRIYIQDDVSC